MILREDQAKVAYQTRLNELITWEYLHDTKNSNFLYIRNKFFKEDWLDIIPWNDRYESDTFTKAQLLNVWSWVFTMVSETIAKYVWDPWIDTYFPTKKLVRDYITLWFAIFDLERINWKIKVNYLPAHNFYERDWKYNVLSFYERFDENGWIEEYFLQRSYKWSIIENKLFRVEIQSKHIWRNMWEFNALENATEVPLNTLVQTDWLQPIVDTWLSQTFFIIRESKLYPERSLIEKIKDLVYSIDRKEVMFETQFLQHIESLLLLKNIDLPLKLLKIKEEWEKISLSSIWRIITGNDQSSIEFINNVNPLIIDAVSQRLHQLEEISSITWIPLDFLAWNERVWSIWEDSRAMLHWNFVKTITWIRELFDEVLEQLLDIIENENWSINKLYVWEDIIVKSDKVLAEEVFMTYWKMRLISRKTALKRYLKLSDEELVEEELQIELDKQKDLEQLRKSELAKANAKAEAQIKVDSEKTDDDIELEIAKDNIKKNLPVIDQEEMNIEWTLWSMTTWEYNMSESMNYSDIVS